jgi:hypothetical protein
MEIPMIKSIYGSLVLLALLVSGCLPAHAPSRDPETLIIDNELVLSLVLPENGWELAREAPDFLVRQIVDHLREEAVASGLRLNDRQLQQVARKRLAVNEGFVVNPDSLAYLMIDFRRMSSDEAIPDKDSLIGSAYGAELSLKNERGVTGVSSKIRRVRIDGSHLAYRTDIRYRLNGHSRKFVGIIGRTGSYRFYFYFNDLLHDPVNAEQMNSLFRTLAIRSATSR